MRNPGDVELDRALSNRYRLGIKFGTLYIDLDDTLLLRGEVNLDALALVFDCINRGIAVKLLTRHAADLDATLTRHRLAGVFDHIRQLFTKVPEARTRGFTPRTFSFNVPGGRCEACEGDGVVKVEMHFLPDVYVSCDVCRGQRYNRETLEVQWKGKNIAQILDMTVEDAHAFLKAVPAIARKLQTLLDVGLSYVKLGQSATTLSGGEAQRVKLSLELSKRDTGRTLYILDEPTTGLHFADIALLLKVLHQLRDAGNTVVVIEHNLDVIKTADWVIDMGPEGGAGGGIVVAVGTPEDIAAHPKSHTGRYLQRLL
jgi:excinuclease ABC subunit A